MAKGRTWGRHAEKASGCEQVTHMSQSVGQAYGGATGDEGTRYGARVRRRDRGAAERGWMVPSAQDRRNVVDT